jgi:hypothetical protein
MSLSNFIGKGVLTLGKATVKGLGGAAKVAGAIGAPIVAVNAFGVASRQAQRNQSRIAGLNESNLKQFISGRAQAQIGAMSTRYGKGGFMKGIAGAKQASQAMINQYGINKYRSMKSNDFKDAMLGLFKMPFIG